MDPSFATRVSPEASPKHSELSMGPLVEKEAFFREEKKKEVLESNVSVRSEDSEESQVGNPRFFLPPFQPAWNPSTVDTQEPNPKKGRLENENENESTKKSPEEERRLLEEGKNPALGHRKMPPADFNSSRSRRRATVPFLSKLVQLFEEEPDLIQWRDGSIAIPNPRKLEAKLPVYFRHAKYTSFQRQLNNFGYTKVDRSSMEYSVYVKSKGPAVKTIDDLLNLNHVRRLDDDNNSENKKQPQKAPHPFFGNPLPSSSPKSSASSTSSCSSSWKNDAFDIVDSLLTLRHGNNKRKVEAVLPTKFQQQQQQYLQQQQHLQQQHQEQQRKRPYSSSPAQLAVASHLMSLPSSMQAPLPACIPNARHWSTNIAPLSQFHRAGAY